MLAHRNGVVLERLGDSLPPMIVVGVGTAPGHEIDTLTHPPADYDDAVAEFGRLRARLRTAIGNSHPPTRLVGSPPPAPTGAVRSKGHGLRTGRLSVCWRCRAPTESSGPLGAAYDS